MEFFVENPPFKGLLASVERERYNRAIVNLKSAEDLNILTAHIRDLVPSFNLMLKIPKVINRALLDSLDTWILVVLLFYSRSHRSLSALIRICKYINPVLVDWPCNPAPMSEREFFGKLLNHLVHWSTREGDFFGSCQNEGAYDATPLVDFVAVRIGTGERYEEILAACLTNAIGTLEGESGVQKPGTSGDRNVVRNCVRFISSTMHSVNSTRLSHIISKVAPRLIFGLFRFLDSSDVRVRSRRCVEDSESALRILLRRNFPRNEYPTVDYPKPELPSRLVIDENEKQLNPQEELFAHELRRFERNSKLEFLEKMCQCMIRSSYDFRDTCCQIVTENYMHLAIFHLHSSSSSSLADSTLAKMVEFMPVFGNYLDPLLAYMCRLAIDRRLHIIRSMDTSLFQQYPVVNLSSKEHCEFLDHIYKTLIVLNESEDQLVRTTLLATVAKLSSRFVPWLVDQLISNTEWIDQFETSWTDKIKLEMPASWAHISMSERQKVPLGELLGYKNTPNYWKCFDEAIASIGILGQLFSIFLRLAIESQAGKIILDSFHTESGESTVEMHSLYWLHELVSRIMQIYLLVAFLVSDNPASFFQPNQHCSMRDIERPPVDREVIALMVSWLKPIDIIGRFVRIDRLWGLMCSGICSTVSIIGRIPPDLEFELKNSLIFWTLPHGSRACRSTAYSYLTADQDPPPRSKDASFDMSGLVDLIEGCIDDHESEFFRESFIAITAFNPHPSLVWNILSMTVDKYSCQWVKKERVHSWVLQLWAECLRIVVEFWSCGGEMTQYNTGIVDRILVEVQSLPMSHSREIRGVVDWGLCCMKQSLRLFTEFNEKALLPRINQCYPGIRASLLPPTASSVSATLALSIIIDQIEPLAQGFTHFKLDQDVTPAVSDYLCQAAINFWPKGYIKEDLYRIIGICLEYVRLVRRDTICRNLGPLAAIYLLSFMDGFKPSAGAILAQLVDDPQLVTLKTAIIQQTELNFGRILTQNESLIIRSLRLMMSLSHHN